MSDINEEVVEVPSEPPRPVGTFYLRFSSEEEFLQAAEEAGFVLQNPTDWEEKETQEMVTGPGGEEEIVVKKEMVPIAWEKVLVCDAFGYSIDVVGKITKGGQWELSQDGEMVELESPVELSGWHVNYSGILPKSFDVALIRPPKNPHRMLSLGAYDPEAPVSVMDSI